jgi:superfamily II DNA or RNA helicase
VNDELESALAECARLRDENLRLRERLYQDGIRAGASPDAKVALFRSLFRGREDVYAVRWEASNGRWGYAPARGRNGEFLPLTDEVLRRHLVGNLTGGIYPMLADETCQLLALDLGKPDWQADAAAFLAVCKEVGVAASLERSRSGNGGHLWIFFDRPVPVATARRLGSVLLDRAIERRYQIGLDTYDRFFPGQDTEPKAGFGKLIALPLQRGPRRLGHSLFVDEAFRPYSDQWAYLASVERVAADRVEKLIQRASRASAINRSQLPKRLRLVRNNLVYIPKENLPSPLLHRLIRLAAFPNPAFDQAQSMRLSTFGKPRIVACAEEFPDKIGLPRGCLESATRLLKSYGIEVQVQDQRFEGVRLDEVAFRGELRPLQQAAVAEIAPHDEAVVSAPTAFGKTALAAWLIGERKVNTLVLVHRRQLMDQWRERLATFLDQPLDSIGQIGGGKEWRTGRIDVAAIQSVQRKGEVKGLVAEYGQVIVDECHHVPAFTFERVLKKVRARFVLGLTATPARKDGHHPILYMQCGPLRFELDPARMARTAPFDHRVLPRPTGFRAPVPPAEPAIQELYAALVLDAARNEQITKDLIGAVEAGRTPLLLTGRTEHLDRFAALLDGRVRNVFVLRGGMGSGQRKAVSEAMAAVPVHEPRVILATGSYLGEGFDDARLDTLFLAMPVSWRGTLQQYVGRLHRLHDNKRVVQVYDYVDVQVPVFARMYEKRLRGYAALGYRIDPPPAEAPQRRVLLVQQRKVLVRIRVEEKGLSAEGDRS